MGKGDQKSRRGKITAGSYGKRRPRKSSNSVAVAEKPVKAKAELKPKVAKPKVEKKVEADVEEKPKAKKTTKKTEE
ncbi:30S ribosomal protein THX [Soonwooa sp.]|uniref:30S ribosomal protein THX n=1 Tax=Soonwooa sp. TaxID=1938592 RepID=UPI003916F189